MIYLEPTTLGWRPIMVSWINSLPETLTKENGDLLEGMFEWLVDPCLRFVKKNCKVSKLSEHCNDTILGVK